MIRRIGEAFEKKGAHVLDAPVLASPATAADREVIVMPSGDKDVYERLLPVFESFADKIVYQGDLGMGSTCKLVNNMITLAVRQVVAEGLTLGMKAGTRPRCPYGGRQPAHTRHSKGRLRANRLPRQIRPAIIPASTWHEKTYPWQTNLPGN